MQVETCTITFAHCFMKSKIHIKGEYTV